MDSFSITQLSQFSGIKPHTIRMWEHRYNALSPERSEGNTRHYDNMQLRRLLNIVSLMQSEYKVSELCSMPDTELNELIAGLYINTPKETSPDYFVSQLIAAGMEFNEAFFEKIFSRCLLIYGLKDTYKKVLYPVLVRIGLMWSGNMLSPGAEHFISNLVRQKLLSAIDSLPPEQPGEKKWLLFLPENEFHEIGLLFSQYLIRESGKKVIYLGANVPLASLVPAAQHTDPDALLLFFVHHDLAESTQHYIEALNVQFGKQIYISGNPALIEQIGLNEKTFWLKTIDDLEKQLTN